MSLSFFFSQEQTSRFNYVFSTDCIPLQVSRISFSCYADCIAVHDQFAIFYVSFDSTVKLSVHSVILQHIC